MQNTLTLNVEGRMKGGRRRTARSSKPSATGSRRCWTRDSGRPRRCGGEAGRSVRAFGRAGGPRRRARGEGGPARFAVRLDGRCGQLLERGLAAAAGAGASALRARRRAPFGRADQPPRPRRRAVVRRLSRGRGIDDGGRLARSPLSLCCRDGRAGHRAAAALPHAGRVGELAAGLAEPARRGAAGRGADRGETAASERKSAKKAAAKKRPTAAKTSDAHCHESRAARSAASRGEAKRGTGLKQRKKSARERTLVTSSGEALSAADVKERAAERRRHERSLAFAFCAAEDAASVVGGSLVQLDSVGVRLLSAASAERLLLRNVTLSVGPRARIAVLGRNGAGIDLS